MVKPDDTSDKESGFMQRTGGQGGAKGGHARHTKARNDGAKAGKLSFHGVVCSGHRFERVVWTSEAMFHAKRVCRRCDGEFKALFAGRKERPK